MIGPNKSKHDTQSDVNTLQNQINNLVIFFIKMAINHACSYMEPANKTKGPATRNDIVDDGF